MLRFCANRAWTAGLIMLLLATGFTVARLVGPAKGDITSFMIHGEDLSSPATAPPGVPRPRTLSGAGYDGQFFYRMALEPTDLRIEANGIRLDGGVRRQRIGYPVLAFLISGGRPQLIPTALVVVNVLALSLAALTAGLLCISFGRHSLWGLLVAGYAGLVAALSRDLAEPTCFALLLLALLALNRGRNLAAAAAMAGAALTRETALLLPAALVVCSVAGMIRHRTLRDWRDVARWSLPVVVWGGWQVTCKIAYGRFPQIDSPTGAAPPGTAAWQAVARWVDHPTSAQLALLLGLVTVTFAATAAAAFSPARLRFLVVAMLLSALVVLSTDSAVWNDDAVQLRMFSEVHLYATVALLASGRRLATPVVALATAGVTVLVSTQSLSVL